MTAERDDYQTDVAFKFMSDEAGTGQETSRPNQ